MHPQALAQIERHVVGSLKNCDIAEGWPVYNSFAPHVQSLANELLKHKSQWLTDVDVFSVFYDLVYERLRETEKQTTELAGHLIDILGDEALLLLGQRLVDFYESIPRDYEVYLQLPAVSVSLETIAVSKVLSVVTFEDPRDVPGGYRGGLLGLFDTKLEPKKVYFRVAVSGYCNRNLDNATVRTALSCFKIATQQGIAKALLKIKEDNPAGLGLLGGLSHYSVPKTKLVCVDKASGGERIVSIELPLEVSKLLGSLDLDKSNKDISAAIDSGRTAHLLNGFLRLPAALMESNAPEAGRVKSAIEWCFDTYATDNTTMSFLQTCFGLEALFGDDAETDGVSRTLADRCAYLVSTNIKGRSTIRDNFKQLYSIRSKIVHGNASSLAPDQRHFLNWGRTVLEHAIFKELKHLELPQT
ncbi:MAG: hypothetical protein KJ787_04620 [Gammaproteobacteria bacterium]|nr:hypothetical protein [Gammaproteobacteria bacterium]MBU1645596.1 hypothetical protein [Gammaproteobacteria bacterium]MBU1973602.1 hypothetical protein [Gammaproteobacteria bacterium]